MARSLLGGKSVEFPTNGGGGNYVYYSGTREDFQEYILLASVIKYKQSQNVNFITSGWFGNVADGGEVLGVGFDLSLKISSSFTSVSELITLKDFFAEVNTERWTQITEEEFYDTNSGAGNGGAPA